MFEPLLAPARYKGAWGGRGRLLTRNDRRAAALERKEAALMARLEARVKELEQRDETRARENAALRLAFEIVANIVRRDNPGNPELLRAEAILQAAFPVDPFPPVDMIETLKKLS